MPCGVLLGSGGTADVIPDLLDRLDPPNRKMIVLDDNPERLVKTIIGMLNDEFGDINTQDEVARWFLDGQEPPKAAG